MSILLKKYRTAFTALGIIAKGGEDAQSIARVAMKECIDLGDDSEQSVPTDAEQFVTGWRNFAAQLYSIGKASGFYDHAHTECSFNHEQKLLLVVSEICEGMEGMRGAAWPGIPDDKLPHRPMLEVELADAVIRIMNYASHTGLNVADAVIEKAAFNKTRGHRHGGKRL